MQVRPVRDEAIAATPTLLAEVAQTAAATGGLTERAEAVLESFRRVVDFDASFIALLGPDRRDHAFLVRKGYDDRTVEFLESAAWMDEIEALGMDRERRPVRLCDLPVPAETLRSWAEYLSPTGFREGIGVGLFTADGRFLGVLGMHTESAVPPSDAVRDVLATLAPLIAHAVDPLRPIRAVAGVVGDAVAGAVLTRRGTVLDLPGLPAHSLLAGGSALLRVAANRLGGGGAHATFLSPLGGSEEYLRVTAMGVSAEPPFDAVAVVMLSPSRDLHRLTPRELEVLGVLVEGWSNQAIARGLAITERTVAAHIEHILGKLGVASRTVAAVSALRLGLFVPPTLRSTADVSRE
jgi:DNA-binding CsgD family transcriptional regulator